MRFTHPGYLLLFIPVVVGLWFSFRHVHGIAKTRKRIAFVIRGLLAGALIMALGGPEWRKPNHGLCTIFVLDRSDSISDEDRRAQESFVATALDRLSSDDVGGVVAIGKNAMVESAPAGRRPLGKIVAAIDGSATDLAAGIRLAAANFVDGKAKRIVLVSDGNETSGEVTDAAQVAATDDIQIDVVTLGGSSKRSEASVVSLEAPSDARENQPIEVRAVLDSTVDQVATLTLDRDGVAVKSQEVHLVPGQSSVTMSDKVSGPGFHRYRATLSPTRDTDHRNNVGLSFVNVRGKPRYIVFQQDTGRSELVSALRRNGLDVDLRGPTTVPARAEDFQNYDGILFNDFNAAGLTVAQMKTISAAVRDSGIGFAMIGGENSFLSGGYYGTPIAEALPVDLNVRQRKSFPSTSVCIIVDASGSMAMNEDGIPKLRLAGKAAEATIQMMSPMDRLGLAGSADGVEFVVPMQPLTNKSEAIRQTELLAFGGGGIYIRRSLERAEQELMREPSKVRHLILMADGNDSDEQEGSFPIAARMRANKITTTVVAVGDGKDVAFLRQLAAIGGGRFYLADHAAKLPAIATQDTSIIARSAIEEGRFFPKFAAGEEALAGIDSTPALQAYCLTDARPLARVGMKTHKDDPLLATWQYGLGTSVAFTSDAQSRWAREWVGWPGFDAFWSQLARVASRRATKNSYQTAVRYEGGRGLVEVKAFDALGNPMAATNAKLRVSNPDGTSRDLALSQQAPGVFTSRFDSTATGTYIVSVSEADASGGTRVSAHGFSLPYPPEYRSFRSNMPLMQRVADQARGRVITKPDEALRPATMQGASITEMWPFVVLFAALLLPLDIAVRRIALPLDEIAKKIAARFRRTKPATEQVEVIGRLSAAKQRAAQPTVDSSRTKIYTATEEKPRGDKSRSVAPKSQGSPAKDLLAAKRQRNSEKND